MVAAPPALTFPVTHEAPGQGRPPFAQTTDVSKGGRRPIANAAPLLQLRANNQVGTAGRVDQPVGHVPPLLVDVDDIRETTNGAQARHPQTKDRIMTIMLTMARDGPRSPRLAVRMGAPRVSGSPRSAWVG